MGVKELVALHHRHTLDVAYPDQANTASRGITFLCSTQNSEEAVAGSGQDPVRLAMSFRLLWIKILMHNKLACGAGSIILPLRLVVDASFISKFCAMTAGWLLAARRASFSASCFMRFFSISYTNDRHGLSHLLTNQQSCSTTTNRMLLMVRSFRHCSLKLGWPSW